jgi:protein-tyrosine phosphatase
MKLPCKQRPRSCISIPYRLWEFQNRKDICGPVNFPSAIAGLLPVTVFRRSVNAVEIRWHENAREVDLSLFRGDSPETIDVSAPLVQVTEGSSVILPGLSTDRPHFFKLMASDGSSIIVGERRLFVEGAPNLRDLGGYETTDGQRVKWGLIYRSGNLGRLTDTDLCRIRRLGLRTICDFRTDAEALKLPNRFPDSQAVSYIRLPIQHGDYEPTIAFERISRGDYAWVSENFMIEGYIESVERYPGVWSHLFQLLSDSRNRPLLFHCTGGKDRTGTAAALILLALGVPTETVIADYGLSDGYNLELRMRIYENLRPLGVDLSKVEPYFTAPESRLHALLRHLEAGYGSANRYLEKRAGVSEQMMARLQEDLLEGGW